MGLPTLTTLPTELLILMLFEMPDQFSLESIVLSSPIIYQIYLAVQREVLCRILKNLYGPLMGEAIVAIRSRGCKFADKKEEAIALLDTWRRSKGISEPALKSLQYEAENVRRHEHKPLEFFGLFQFHKKLQFFLGDFEINAPHPPWISQDRWKTSILPIQLSHTEAHRFPRALCRIQIHANIFARPEQPLKPGFPDIIYKDWYQGRESLIEAFHLFFGTLPPWEQAEMGAVWAYLNTKFPPFYKEVSDIMHDLVDKYGTRESFIADVF